MQQADRAQNARDWRRSEYPARVAAPGRPLGGGKIVVDQLIQRLALNRVQLLASAGELVVLEDGHFVGQFLDGIAAYKLPFFPAQDLVPGVQRRHLVHGQSTELVSGKMVEVGALGHARQPSSRDPLFWIWSGSPVYGYSTEMAPSAPRRCQGSPCTRAASCSSVR